ncbi:MAG: hypothetical protein ABI650_12585 [Dokdonella sp.]
MALPQARAQSLAGNNAYRPRIDVAALPLTAASVLQRVELFHCDCVAAGIVVTPDSQRALLAVVRFDDGPIVYGLPSTVADAATLEPLPLPPGFDSANGLEDIGLSTDDRGAIAVGNSPTDGIGLPALHILAPFTAAAAALSALDLPGGRGAGSAHFVPSPVPAEAVFAHGIETPLRLRRVKCAGGRCS